MSCNGVGWRSALRASRSRSACHRPNVDAKVLLGDLLVVAGGALWAATTLIAKGTRLRNAAPEKALGYQVAISIPILGFASWLFGENITHMPSVLSISLLAYQAIWVVGCTFVLWFALVKTYSAEQIVVVHLHHAAVRRRRRLLHHARYVDHRVRRRGAAGHRRALSREQAGSEGHAGPERAGVSASVIARSASDEAIHASARVGEMDCSSLRLAMTRR